MPRAEFCLRATRKDVAMQVVVQPKDANGYVALQTTQNGVTQFLALAPADWARIIPAIQASMKDPKP